MSDFIDELLIVNIVSRLPVESVLQCRCVCKRWRDLLHELHFTQIHTDTNRIHQQQKHQEEILSFFMLVNIPETNNYEYHLQDHYVNYEHYAAAADVFSFPPWPWSWSSSSSSHKVSRPLYPPVQLVTDIDDAVDDEGNSLLKWYIVGSVNGLICLYALYFNSREITIGPIFIIYNPITREYLNVPNDDSLCISYGAFGFGYHPSKNEYKIVKIVQTFNDEYVRWIQIYTLGSGKWRINKAEETVFCYIGYIYSDGVPFNGAIYWLSLGEKIVSFDMEDEKFRVIPLPPMSTSIFYQLRVLAEHLCLIEEITSNIWVMNNEDNNFTNIISININNDKDNNFNREYSKFSILNLSEGRILCLYDRGSLISYDHRTNSSEYLGDIPLFEEGSYSVVSYTKSLVSLKALGEEDAKIIKQQHATATEMKRTNPTTTTTNRKRRSIDMKTEMIKLFTSLLLNVYVD